MRIPHARKASISLLALGAALAVSGCATSQEDLLPTQSGVTMAGIWEGANGDAMDDSGSESAHVTRLERARSSLRRPIATANLTAERSAYTRTAANEIQSQFSRLPNPDMTLYVFAHLSGGTREQVPVPGYTTIFPLYDRPYYAQPGERAEYQTVDSQAGATR